MDPLAALGLASLWLMFPAQETERLLIRCAIVDDLDALTSRRNEPEVALYQNWTLPYSSERGRELLESVAQMGGPVNEEWWMATVLRRDSGEIIGDLAVRLSWAGRAAEVGYSFSSAHWGRGYASEALQALIQYLFEDLGVSRVSATLHPDNIASAMLLERAGLLYEGHTKLSYWGEGEGAVNSDDLLYGFTKADCQAWRDRPVGPPDDVRLVEVTATNRRAVASLATHKSQERFVSPMALSFCDALFPPQANGATHIPMLRAIEADGELAGFVMLALASDANPEPHLWRLLIDRKHQRRGIGGRAVDLVEEMFRANNCETILVCWVEGQGTPMPFYLARGFEPTGQIIDGETQARKSLT